MANYIIFVKGKDDVRLSNVKDLTIGDEWTYLKHKDGLESVIPTASVGAIFVEDEAKVIRRPNQKVNTNATKEDLDFPNG